MGLWSVCDRNTLYLYRKNALLACHEICVGGLAILTAQVCGDNILYHFRKIRWFKREANSKPYSAARATERAEKPVISQSTKYVLVLVIFWRFWTQLLLHATKILRLWWIFRPHAIAVVFTRVRKLRVVDRSLVQPGSCRDQGGTIATTLEFASSNSDSGYRGRVLTIPVTIGQKIFDSRSCLVNLHTFLSFTIYSRILVVFSSSRLPLYLSGGYGCYPASAAQNAILGRNRIPGVPLLGQSKIILLLSHGLVRPAEWGHSTEAAELKWEGSILD